jgi:Luciferase-like monooxygenase
VAPGLRPDDFEAADRPFPDRFRRFDDGLVAMARVWNGEAVAGQHPAAPGRSAATPRLLIGGMSEGALRRVVDHADGWTAPGLPLTAVAPFAERVRDAWADAGRAGSPRIVGLASYRLNDGGGIGIATTRGYYGFLGDMAESLAQAVLDDEGTIRETADGFKASRDELILNPTVPDLTQVDLLAEALGVRP